MAHKLPQCVPNAEKVPDMPSPLLLPDGCARLLTRPGRCGAPCGVRVLKKAVLPPREESAPQSSSRGRATATGPHGGVLEAEERGSAC